MPLAGFRIVRLRVRIATSYFFASRLSRNGFVRSLRASAAYLFIISALLAFYATGGLMFKNAGKEETPVTIGSGEPGVIRGQ